MADNQTWLEEILITLEKSPNSDLMLLWTAMDYQFNRHAFLASYCPHEVLYGRELLFPKFIWKKLGYVVDLDDPNIGQSVCRSRLNSSRRPCLWPWRVCPLLSTMTNDIMHAFAVVLTNLNCGDFDKGIMFISNVRQI